MRRRRHPERAVQQHVLHALRLIAGSEHVWSLGTTRRRGDYPGTMQSPGLPDVIAFLPWPDRAGDRRRLVVMECKAPGGRLREAQAVFRADCLAAEIVHLVGGLDTVLQWLVNEGYLKASQVPHYRLTPPITTRSS